MYYSDISFPTTDVHGSWRAKYCQRTESEEGKYVGKGSFWFRYRATANINGNPNSEVAVKMLQPIDPGPDARQSTIQVYKVNFRTIVSILI